MRYKADHHLLSQFHRMPGIPSSFSGLEVFTGKDIELALEDWLGGKYEDVTSCPSLHGD